MICEPPHWTQANDANRDHADNGKRFIDYLLRPQTEQRLAESEAAQMPVRSGVEIPAHVTPLEQLTPMTVDYGTLAPMLDELSRGYLKQWVDRNLQ